MRKLITLVAGAVLGISTIGCAEKKTPTTPAPAPGAEAPKVEGGTPAPAPATTDEKK